MSHTGIKTIAPASRGILERRVTWIADWIDEFFRAYTGR
jgi:hypothetical protein